MNDPKRLDDFVFNGTRFSFKPEIEDIHIKAQQTADGYIVIIHEPLALFAFGKTMAELVEAVAENIYVNWHEYALAPDEDLNDKAKEIKANLLRVFNVEAV